jgi:hypothetical protein
MKFPSILLTASLSALLLISPGAKACLVCKASPLESVLVTELEGSEEVVVGRPSESGEPDRFRIDKILKGSAGLKGIEVKATLPLFSTDAGKTGRGAVLLTRWNKDANWIIRGPAVDRYHTAFYDEVLSLSPRENGDLIDEVGRVTFFMAYLHHEDSILAKAAATEVANASYAAIKVAKRKLDPVKIREALADPAIGDR